jgi:hypothetical protein
MDTNDAGAPRSVLTKGIKVAPFLGRDLVALRDKSRALSPLFSLYSGIYFSGCDIEQYEK